jgi:cytochrome c oxidase subunit 1
VSARSGRVAGSNPWDATTLEWDAVEQDTRVYRKPYEYSVPGAPADFVPQSERDAAV